VGAAGDVLAGFGAVDTGLGDGVLDRLPTRSMLGGTRIGGVGLNRPRMRDALAAVVALASAPSGFTVAEFTAKVHALTRVDRDYERMRVDMQTLFNHLAIDTPLAA